VQRIIYTNSQRKTIELYLYPFLLNNVDGLGDVDAEVQTQKAPFQDGSTYINSTLEHRVLTVEVSVHGEDLADTQQKRVLLSSVLNPKLGIGTLRYENDYGIREIDAVLDNVPVFPSGQGNRGGTFQRVLINFICPNPYWKSLNITEEPTFEPLFQFPFEGVFEMGMQRDKRIIENDGDAPAPIYIEFFGPADNPIITNNTTGEYIKVNQSLAEGEFMRVDTTPGNKSVEFVSPDGTVTNVFNWIDLGSTFFQLAIGENEIEYSADNDIQGAIVNIRYNKLYVGV
jgi:phage-related protein